MGKWPLGQKETLVIFLVALGTVAFVNRTAIGAQLGQILKG